VRLCCTGFPCRRLLSSETHSTFDIILSKGMEAAFQRSRTVPRPLVVARVACSLLTRPPARLLILTEYHTQAWQPASSNAVRRRGSIPRWVGLWAPESRTHFSRPWPASLLPRCPSHRPGRCCLRHNTGQRWRFWLDYGASETRSGAVGRVPKSRAHRDHDCAR
jgi:hypothetical protein